MRQRGAILLLALGAAGTAGSAELQYKQRLLTSLIRQVPQLLKTFDSKTGRFGAGIWICQDQHPMYPLAVAYATAGRHNPYYKDPKLLDVIVRAADPLIEGEEKGAGLNGSSTYFARS